MSKLLLCCGTMAPSGYVRLDADARYLPDIVATIPPLPEAVMRESWDVIELIHGIEHFYLWEAEQLLRECHEALAAGGVLILEQPDIEFAARVLTGQAASLTNVPSQSDMWPLYGDPTHHNPLYMHKWGWTPVTLRAALVTAGFQTVDETRAQHHLPGRDFRLEGFK